MSSKSIITAELLQAKEVLDAFLSDDTMLSRVEKAAEMLEASIESGGKIISCGNGGSHADAMHFAEELTGRYRKNREPIAAIAISDPTHMSCVANDFGFEEIFARHVQALGKPEDVLVGFSTSGNSANVIRAFEEARKAGMKTIALTGNGGGKLAEATDLEIRVPHEGYSDRIQEIHIKVVHILILLLESDK